jgi:hypothetical protein
MGGSHRDQAGEWARNDSAKGRDIGRIPSIKSVKRRGACRNSLRRFCETYNPEAFYLEWSKNQLAEIDRIEEVVRFGALYAFADPRGDGKTTRVRMASLWAAAYAFRRYTFVIGANASKAQDNLAAIKMFIRFLPLFTEDFPEISHAVKKLAGIANRASGQTCDDEPTMIEWSQDRITLPTVPPPENWPKAWALRDDGMAPTSGVVVGASGLTGDGIRGSVLTLTTGEQLRPDLVLLDDPQTDESAASPSQNDSREALVAGAVLGMAGPGRTISAVMPCTVIKPGDFIDRILDRKKHPLWRGARTSLLPSMPKNLDAWEDYFQVYREDAQKEPPDFTASNALYLERREILDEGAEAAWPARKLPHEVSAIQHGMHLFCRNRRAFFAEYQNKPEAEEVDADPMITPAEIVEKINNHRLGVVPANAQKITAFVDVSKSLLWYAVCAWGDGFEGHVIEYGAWPDQKRPYFIQRDARPSLMDGAKHGEEAAVYAALDALTRRLIEHPWPRDTGGDMRLNVCGIDSGDYTDQVYQLCRQSPHASVLQAVKGRGVGPSAEPMPEWHTRPGEQKGLYWIRRPAFAGRPVSLTMHDVNFWKSFIHGRLGVPKGGRGSLSLYGDKTTDHRMLADHITSERRDVQSSANTGRQVAIWKAQPHRPDNHLFDCVVGAAMLASTQGIGLDHAPAVSVEPLAPVSYKALQAAAKKARGR